MKIHLFVRSRSRRGGSVGDLQELDVEAMEDLRAPMTEAVIKAIGLLESKVKQMLSRQADTSGMRVKRRSGGSVFSRKGRNIEAVQVSSPAGTPPAKRTGDLLDSIRATLPRRPRKRNPNRPPAKRGWSGRVRGAVWTHNHYASLHEYGGRVGRRKLTRLPARPFFRPAIAAVEAEVGRIFDAL